MGSLGFGEILLIFLVLLLLFGAKKLPELARGLGKSLREFKKATSEIQDEIENAGKIDSKTTSADFEVDKEKENSQKDSRKESEKH